VRLLDLRASLARAEQRLGGDPSSRQRRADRGRSRLHPEVLARLTELLQGHQRPPVREIQDELERFCAGHDATPPARATIYQMMAQLPATSYAIEELPEAVRSTLYNLSPTGDVPGHQLAFHCLNYGTLEAISFAAGMPWLALYQAARLPGWRRRSRGLLEAILKTRGIS
jgi:hypothetical protein